MRTITLLSFITLDGVMQAPGGPEEDPSAKFEFGGWQAPFDDPAVDAVTGPALQAPVEYLLGRKTFDIWETYWPKHSDIWPGINEGMKYVFSSTRSTTDWQNTTFIESIDDVKQLIQTDGPDLHIWGSSKLVQLLLEHELIDEMNIMTYPIILGQGKRLFADGAAPSTFTLLEGHVGTTGVITARYKRAGEVHTGSVG